MPPLQLEEEGDTWESWEDTDPDAIQLATTPVKETVLKSPGSPGPLKVYDGPYLLQFRAVPPNPRVKSFFPQESQHHRGKERERDHHKEKDSQEDKRDRKPRRLESRAGFGQQDTSAPRDRPFANLGITSDQRPVVIDPDAAPPTNPFFQPLPVPVRPLFGTQMAGKGGASQQTAKQQQQQRALARLERRVANPFRVNKPDNELQATVKKVQGILNKITPEKYEELFAQMWDELNEFNLYDVDDDDAMNVLDQVIGLIFEKALAEANYSKMYADIARDLCDMAIQVSQETGNSDAKPLEHFRKMLLDRCQTEFETRLTQLPADPAERYRVETRHRKRGVGNIKFIAELFKLNMLTEKIMHDVIKQLLLGPPPHSEQYLPTVEELEVLCKLWSVAGKLLDRPAALEYINYYFAIMRRHSETYPEIRLRFIVADIIDLRSNGWMPRREQGTAKKITEEGHGQGRHGAAERPRAKDGRGGAKAARGERGGDAPARPTPTALLTRPKGDARSAPSSGSPVGTGPPTTPVSGDPGPEAGLPHGKGRDRSKGGQRGKEQKARGKGQPQPVSPVVPTGPKELSGEEMDSKVLWLISEFAETQNAVELLDCLNELGAVNHPLFVARAVYRVIENHRLGDERLVLACLLEAFARAAQEKAAAKQRAAALEKGFQLALRDVFDFEAWVDSPFLWRDLSDFLVELLLKGVIQFDFLNAMFHPDTYVQFPEVLQDFIADLFSNLKAKELEWVACTGFYRILSFFPAEHLPRLLQALQDKEVIETDITLFAYRAVSSNEAVTDCFEVLESRVDAELLKSYQAVVCAKVASGVLTCISAGAAARTVQQCDADAIAAFEASALEAAKPLLARYSKCEDPEFEVRLQVTVLNELHRACSMYRFPKGHMSRMFRLLYELGVCSSFAFEDWIEGASDVPDKGKAIFEVNSFLQSLKVAEQPPADDEATDDATDEAEDDGSD